jgi:carbon starvation protein
MSTLLVAVAAYFGFLLAYHTYGRWLGRHIFGLDPQAPVPSRALCDKMDFIPTRREVVFGHHFTSIAGTGPIVGPAIAVFWGWLPALLWVLLGCVFIGAVHDFGALVVSFRNRGQTVGEIAGRMIAPRARVLFLTILFFALSWCWPCSAWSSPHLCNYPESVLSVWVAMPVAVWSGSGSTAEADRYSGRLWSALSCWYAAVYVGAYLSSHRPARVRAPS